MFARIFLAHPRQVGESYGEHAVFALGVAGQLLAAALACAVHAVAPALFERTASRAIHRLYHRLTSGRRGAETAQPVDPACA